MSASLELLRWGVRVCAAAAIGSLVYGIASAPTRERTQLGLRGLKRQKALQDNDLWASFEPFVRWLGVRLGGVLTDEMRAKVDEQITRAGDFLGLTPDEYVSLSVIGAVGGTFAGVLLGWTLEYPPEVCAIVFGIAGAAGLHLHLQGVADERMKTISRTLPYAIDLMALSMSAGLDFPGATRQVIEKTSTPTDPLVEEFTLLLQALSLGRTRRDALTEFARRNATSSAIEFANAIIQAEERGNPVADVLTIQAGVSRTRRSIRAEESAAKAAAKLVFPLMLVLGVVLILLIGPVMIGLSDTL